MTKKKVRLARAGVRYTLRLVVNHFGDDDSDDGHEWTEFLVDLRAGGAVTSEGWLGYTGDGRYLLHGSAVELGSDDNGDDSYGESLTIARKQAEAVLSRASTMIRDEGADLLTVLGTFAESGEGPARPGAQTGTGTDMEQWRTAMRDRICCQVWFAPGNGVRKDGGSDRFDRYSALADRAEEMGLLLVVALWRECARPWQEGD